MKKKPSALPRPKRGRQASASCDSATDPSTASGSIIPANPDSPPQTRHLKLAQQSQNLLQFLNEDRTRQKFCDVSVSVGGKVYSAHKVVLAHGSSYFHAEVSKNPAAMAHVTLDHVEDSVFQHLLGFLYTAECVVAEMDIPAITEAARFLDMMDVVKLLCEEGEVHPVSVIQDQDETRGSPEVEITSSDSPGTDTNIQIPPDVNVSLLNNPLNSLLTESQTQEEKTTGQRNASTRRLARRRRTPSKYKRDEVACSVSIHEKTLTAVSDVSDEARERTVENQGPKTDVKETSKPAQGDDVMDEHEEEDGDGDVNTDIVKVVEVSGANKSAGEQASAEKQVVREVELHVPAAGSANQCPVYPEGLAPLTVQIGSRKVLKCPKCDKIFDRTGENHTECYQ